MVADSTKIAVALQQLLQMVKENPKAPLKMSCDDTMITWSCGEGQIDLSSLSFSLAHEIATLHGGMLKSEGEGFQLMIPCEHPM